MSVQTPLSMQYTSIMMIIITRKPCILPFFEWSKYFHWDIWFDIYFTSWTITKYQTKIKVIIGVIMCVLHFAESAQQIFGYFLYSDIFGKYKELDVCPLCSTNHHLIVLLWSQSRRMRNIKLRPEGNERCFTWCIYSTPGDWIDKKFPCPSLY